MVSRESADFTGPDVWCAEACNVPAAQHPRVPWSDTHPVHYVYVLRSGKDGHLYTGSTTDLRQRVDDHLAGRVCSTRNRRPLQFIYDEAYLSAKDTKSRALFLRSGSGKRFIRRQLSDYLSGRGRD